MNKGELGKIYHKGENIIRQNDVGDCMYVIQSGKVEVIQEQKKKDIHIATLREGDFFGEMSIFEHEVRSNTVRAIEDVRVLTVDKKNFLRRIHEDPSLAFNIVQTLSQRLRKLDNQFVKINVGDRRNWYTRPEKFTDHKV